jgi:hypothetical protein
MCNQEAAYSDGGWVEPSTLQVFFFLQASQAPYLASCLDGDISLDDNT